MLKMTLKKIHFHRLPLSRKSLNRIFDSYTYAWYLRDQLLVTETYRCEQPGGTYTWYDGQMDTALRKWLYNNGLPGVPTRKGMNIVAHLLETNEPDEVLNLLRLWEL